MMRDKIEAFFEKNRAAFLADLKALVAIDSSKSAPKPGMPYGEGCARVLAAAAGLAGNMGFEVRNLDNRVMTADVGAGVPELGILAHLDVVPAGEGWHYPPFEGRIENGRMYGRGTSDDKGACVAALYAMKAAEEIAPLKKACRLIMGADEECGCSDLEYYKNLEKMPAHVFSPDGDFPVYNTEKGQFSPSFSARWKEESGGARVLAFHSGSAAANVVPARAEALICGLDRADVEKAASFFSGKLGLKIEVAGEGDALRLTAFGIPSHASTPWEGRNAQTALLSFLAGLPLGGACAEKLRALEALFPYGDNEGKALGVAEADALSGPLTMNFSILNAEETGLSGRVDCRTPVCTDQMALTKKVRAALESSGFCLDSAECRPAHHTPPESAFVQALLRAYEDFTGEKGRCCAMGGCTYAHGIPGAVSFGPTRPGRETNLHSADEYVVLEDLFTAAKIFTKVILDICT